MGTKHSWRNFIKRGAYGDTDPESPTNLSTALDGVESTSVRPIPNTTALGAGQEGLYNSYANPVPSSASPNKPAEYPTYSKPNILGALGQLKYAPEFAEYVADKVSRGAARAAGDGVGALAAVPKGAVNGFVGLPGFIGAVGNGIRTTIQGNGFSEGFRPVDDAWDHWVVQPIGKMWDVMDEYGGFKLKSRSERLQKALYRYAGLDPHEAHKIMQGSAAVGDFAGGLLGYGGAAKGIAKLLGAASKYSRLAGAISKISKVPSLGRAAKLGDRAAKLGVGAAFARGMADPIWRGYQDYRKLKDYNDAMEEALRRHESTNREEALPITKEHLQYLYDRLNGPLTDEELNKRRMEYADAYNKHIAQGIQSGRIRPPASQGNQNPPEEFSLKIW